MRITGSWRLRARTMKTAWASSQPSRRGTRFGQSTQLATNGGALMANVVVAGASGFLFWIVAARTAPTTSVAEAAALITAMMGVLQISQQMLIANVPMMITSSPRPGWILSRAYIASTVLIVVGSIAYVLVAPRVATGMEYLSDPGLALIFVVGSVLWGFFGLQDAALSGILKGHLVLLENALWGVLRLVAIVALPIAVSIITPGWILSTWLVPALVMVIAVNYYLYVPASAPLRHSRGNHTHPPRQLIGHLGWETLTAMGNGGVNIVLPAIVLTAVGADTAAPFFAAYSFILVGESALGSFTAAYAVEIRRGGVGRSQTRLTMAVLAGSSIAAIAGAVLLGRQFMGLLGPEYRVPGGTVLAILTLGIPFRSITLLSGSINREAGEGWRNALQQFAYVVVSFGAIAILGTDDINELAIALVIGRIAASIIAVGHLRSVSVRRIRSRSSRLADSPTSL